MQIKREGGGEEVFGRNLKQIMDKMTKIGEVHDGNAKNKLTSFMNNLQQG